MGKILRVLSIEDSERDVLLLRRHLTNAGYELISDRVDTAEGMSAALAAAEWDVILCDYAMPHFNVLQALEVVKATALDLPFIIISGSIGETAAVEAMRFGAHDYLMKDNLARLAPTIQREIQEAANRRARRQAEAALRESEDRYRDLVEHSHDLICTHDLEGRLLSVNQAAARVLGYKRSTLLGRNIQEAFLPEFRAGFGAYVDELRLNGVAHGLMIVLTASGEKRTWEYTNTLRTEGVAVPVVRGLAHDVTERKQAERGLQAANQQLEQALAELQRKSNELASMTQQLWQASKLATMGELAASIAHELNNPLATVALRTEMLLLPLPERDTQRSSLEVISGEVDRMATLVNNLLQFSRRSHRQVSTVDVGEEIVNTIEFVHYHLRNRRIEIVREFSPIVPSIQADRQQLRQLFLNLLTNAGDAMPDGGLLTLRVTPDGPVGEAGAVIIQFCDSGEGIAPDDLKKIWDPFFTTKPEGRGTGLGLAICRRIVEEHGGTIDIESEISRGTTVSIILPATSNGH
jgi:PAS domain S-box-containing protein